MENHDIHQAQLKEKLLLKNLSLIGVILCTVFLISSLIVQDRTMYDPVPGVVFFGLVYFISKRASLQVVKNTFFILLIIMLVFWSIRSRQMGIEYFLITMACASGLLYHNRKTIVIAMCYCFAGYIVYYVYDKKMPFEPDPSINYAIYPLITMSIAGSIVCAIILVFRNITETSSKKMYEEKEKALLASKAKSDFLANMSHEIRTPLNGVIGFSDLLNRTKLSEQQLQYVNAINQSGNLLLDIINDVLDFSKIESGKLELTIDKIDLLELLNQLCDMVKYQAHKKNLELLLNISSQMPRYVWCDEIRLRQVLVNLLSNAVKFTNEGEIELKVEVDNSVVGESTQFKFSVRDTGIGIAEKNKEKIFESFTQEDSSTTKRFGGTGLGLAISNRLLKYMNSQLSLTTEIDKGSTFTFDVAFKSEKGELVNYEESCNVKNVLIIDDNQNNRLILKEMLSLKNINYKLAEDGLKALDIIKTKEKFDVIIMDYNMPYIDGIETTRMIREIYNDNNQQPIILLYSSSDDELIFNACTELNITQRIVKPVKINQLYRAFNNINLGEKNTNTSNDNLQNSEVAASANSLNTFAKTILLAEDNPFNMKMAVAMLKIIAPSANIVVSVNGTEVVTMFEKYKPSLVLMDIQMPEINGYQATQLIRKIDATVPIIALTAGNVAGEKEKCIEEGMNDFVTKPFIKDTLEAALLKWLK